MNNNKGKILYVGNMLSSHGLSVTTIETLGKQLEECGYQFIYSSEKKPMLQRLADMVWTLVRNRKNLDKVIIDTYSSTAFWFCYVISLLARMFKIPYIPILHGGGLPQRLANRPTTSKQVFQNSMLNVSPSRYLQVAFQQHGFSSVYIPNNIDIERYSFKERWKCEPKLLYVRCFDRIYNPTMAIEVLKWVKEIHPEAELCMVGPDKDGTQKVCHDLAEQLGILESVKFTGKLSKQDWHKLSEDYSIFINTTNYDNMPVSVIEALALGLPVVSTNAGGLPYLLDHGKDAILVEKGDAHQMSEAVLELLVNEDKAHLMSLNGRIKAESFDWNRVKEEWKNILG